MRALQRFTVLVTTGLMATPALAQGTLSTASPIPEGAESRFCYYAGLAYSRNAYIAVSGGSGTVAIMGSQGTGSRSGALGGTGQARIGTDDQLLECLQADDGTMFWRPRATVQSSR